jgi:hypothetical protein
MYNASRRCTISPLLQRLLVDALRFKLAFQGRVVTLDLAVLTRCAWHSDLIWVVGRV